MIHHLVPEKVVEAIDLAASRSGLARLGRFDLLFDDFHRARD
jgi:hypothetical protein